MKRRLKELDLPTQRSCCCAEPNPHIAYCTGAFRGVQHTYKLSLHTAPARLRGATYAHTSLYRLPDAVAFCHFAQAGACTAQPRTVPFSSSTSPIPCSTCCDSRPVHVYTAAPEANASCERLPRLLRALRTHPTTARSCARGEPVAQVHIYTAAPEANASCVSHNGTQLRQRRTSRASACSSCWPARSPYSNTARSCVSPARVWSRCSLPKNAVDVQNAQMPTSTTVLNEIGLSVQ